MKTAICTILFSCLFFFTGCINKKLDYSEKTVQDSLRLFLDLANRDSLPPQVRLNYNKKAFGIIKNQENDSMHRVYLFRVANRYFNLNNLDEYGKTTKIIIKESESKNDTLALAKAYDYLGDYYKNPEKIDSAFICFWKAERLYRKLNNQPKAGYIFGKIASIYSYIGDDTNTELYSFKALKALNGSDDQNSIFESYIELGRVSANRQENQKALEYYDKALEVANKNEIPSVFHPKITVFNNIGVVYQNLNDYEKAKEYFKKGLEEKKLFIDKPRAYAILLGNLAISESNLKNYSNLPDLYYSSLRIKDSLKDFEGIITSKRNLSYYFLDMKNGPKAQKYAHEAFLLAKKMRRSRDILFSFWQLAKIEPEKASFYKLEYIKLKDSLRYEERKIQDKFARIRYETDEVILQKNKAVIQKWTVFWIAVSILLSGLVFYAFRIRQSRQRAFFLLISRQKADEEIYQLISERHQKFEEGREKEKRRIARELHDGVLNRLSSIRASLLVLENKTDSETVKHCISQVAEIQNIEKEVRDIAHGLGRDLFSTKRDYPEFLASVLEDAANKTSLKIDFEIDKAIDWNALDSRKKLGIYQILQECLQAISKQETGTDVTVRLYKNNSLLVMEIDGNIINPKNSEKEQTLKDIGLMAKRMDANLRISHILEDRTLIRMALPL
ncbi:tetratricopeptide repeat-containing sensor histidine kinase [Flavobacterium microcysteis]|uniref:histidine kinase n=1 Tax=Flavobacterium microcysteis TaxID=2596891 RepID=A0A501PZ26_9FLAO|nr:tetratricopeptide repeat-containing sensor histidine kinase [Flavobacterium microcysteis]TPD65294.1 tetratricopeptide repeat protein [Flavobacterium microcysteis]